MNRLMKQIKKVFGDDLHKYTLVIALVALIIFFNIASGGRMITPSNFQNLLSGNAYTSFAKQPIRFLSKTLVF